MQDFAQELVARTDAMWLDCPADIDRLVGRNYDTGKEFSCWAYCWGFLSNLSDELYMVYQLGREGKGDLETYKMLVSERLRRLGGSFQASGHMEDTKKTLEEAADAFEKVETYEELATLARALQRYALQMSFWVDIELPWDEVCKLVDEKWHAKA